MIKHTGGTRCSTSAREGCCCPVKHGREQKPPGRRRCPTKEMCQHRLIPSLPARCHAPAGPRAKSATDMSVSAQQGTQAWVLMFLTLHLSCRLAGLQGAGLDTLTLPHRSDCKVAWLGHSVIHSDRQMIHIMVSRVFSCPKNPARKGLSVSGCPHILLSLSREKVLNKVSITQALVNY